MKTKTLQQTVTFKASPRQVYDMLMDSKKHQSLSGQPAKISRKVGGKFTAWARTSQDSIWRLSLARKSCRRGAPPDGGQTTTQSPLMTSQKLTVAQG